MSTFEGQIEEFPGVRIDQFEEYVDSTIYFLSHIHSDHMVGLASLTFRNHLVEQQLSFYSSEQSTMMLRQWYPDCSNQFRYLQINVPSYLKTSNDLHFTVTLLPAGHCPGSVMFLFENEHHCILYTGDFRVKIDEFKKFPGLYTAQGTLKHISKIHMDTTFMFKRYKRFPTRQESCNAVCNIIAEWIELSPKHSIYLELPYFYGGEVFYTEIFKRFKMPVHVSQRTYECYKFFPNLDKCITIAQDGQIHSNCIRRKDGSSCRCSDENVHLRRIRLSAFIWTDWWDKRSIVKKDNDNYFRVCYSTHASLEELEDILEFLKPDEIEANVLPKHFDYKEELLAQINKYNKKNVYRKCVISNVECKKMTTDSALNSHENNSDEKSSDSEDDEEYVKLMAVQKHLAKKHKGEDSGVDLGILD